jgi:hypothetical protein
MQRHSFGYLTSHGRESSDSHADRKTIPRLQGEGYDESTRSIEKRRLNSSKLFQGPHRSIWEPDRSSPDGIAAFKPLQLDHVAILATGAHQFLVGANLADGAFIEHENTVGVADRAQAMGDHEGGSAV